MLQAARTPALHPDTHGLVSKLQDLGHGVTVVDDSKFIRTKPGAQAGIRRESMHGALVLWFHNVFS